MQLLLLKIYNLKIIIMRNKLLSLLMLVFLFNFSNILIAQGLIVNTPLEKRIANSSFVVEGKVINKSCSWDSGFKSIYTINTVLVMNRIKGNVGNDTINIITPGGIIGFNKIVVFPSLKLSINDFGLFILSRESIDLDNESHNFKKYKPEYSRLSFIKYDLQNNSAFDDFNSYPDIERDLYGKMKSMKLKFENKLKIYGDQDIVPRSPNAVTISSFSPGTITAGTQTVLTINGSGFGSTQGSGKVEFRNADNGGSGYMEPIASEYVSWSNTQIKVEVPSGAGTGDIRVTDNGGSSDVSGSDLTVTYNLTNVSYSSEKYRINLVDADGSGGILFEFYTDFYNDANAMGAFTRALDSWRCSGGTGVYFEDGGSSTVDQAANDDVNVVRFDNGAELPSGVLGRTTNYYSGCGSPIKWFASEIDMVFNDVPDSSSYSWNFDEADGTTGSNQYDFESVSVHELGHAHQLGHVIDASQIMHYSIANGQEKRTLSSDDLDAGNDVLNFSSGVCGKPDMSTYVCSTQPLDLIYFEAGLESTAIKLNWGFDNIFDLDNVEVLKSLNGVDFKTVRTFAGNNKNKEFEYSDYSETPDNYYRLRYVDDEGNVKYSKIIYIFNEKIKYRNDINIYPNPAKDYVIIENDKGDKLFISLLNSDGRIIKKLGSVTRFDLSTLPEGVYFIKITTASESFVKKLYKINH